MSMCPPARSRFVRCVSILGVASLLALSASPQGVRGKPTKSNGQMRFTVPPQTCVGFEGLLKGTRVSSIATPEGPVGITAFNPNFGPLVNAAVIFDSANPAIIDLDLGTPHEDFGGPGVGAGGELGSPYQNDTAKGNLLIVADNLNDSNGDGRVDFPNDADLVGERVTFDFSAQGAVEIESLFFLDMEVEEPLTMIRFYSPSNALIAAIVAPAPGDNGVVRVQYNAQNVRRIEIELNGSAAIDDICFRRMVDCNGNGIQDSKDIALGTSSDCNTNGIPDECEPDCDLDGIPDACEPDCDGDGVPNDCDGPDCDGDGIPDNCDGPDCNANGVPDNCDIAGGTSSDCNANGIPDECEPDCDADGIPDDCDGPDCDANGLPDNCDIAGGAPDCNANGVPDACEPDCDADGIPDACDGPDCDGNGLPDNCDIAGGAPDCNANGIPDACEPDCDADGIPDDCEGPDCNGNGLPDDCDIAGGAPDCNANGVPDSCEPDCDSDGTPDACEPDTDGDGTPDDCEECPPPAGNCDSGCYSIHSQTGRQLAPPDYGLRIDNLFGPGSGSYTFGFDLPGTGGTLCYDGATGTLTINGVGYGGKDIGASWDPILQSFITVEFVYTGVYCSGNKLIAPNSGVAFGTLLWQSSGDVIPLYGQSNSNGEFALLENGDWEGWISLDNDSDTPGTQDWVLDLTPISECPPEPGCHGKIGDFVWNDIDRDGRQDPSEPGIEGVTVLLKDAFGNVLASTTTKPDGSYLFTGLCAGDYEVCVDESTLPPDFVASPCNVGDDELDNDCSPEPVTLSDNLSCDLSIDFGYNSPCSGLIGDFVWLDLDLDGLQDADEPGIEGVTVLLKDCSNNVLASVTTSPFGFYSFMGLCQGCYKVCVDASTLPPGLVASPCNAGSNDAIDNDCSCATVVLTSDSSQDTTVDFGYGQACSGVLGDFVWDDQDCDGVQDPSEPGIEGVLVVLKDEFEVEIASTTTGMNGEYYFAELCAGKYRICVDESTLPPGYVSSLCNVGGNDALDNDCSPVWADLMNDHDSDLSIDFGYCFSPMVGGDGCTPGYWKQSHHFDSWPAPYTPTTLFSDVFEDAFPGMTLLDVLEQGGGGLNALGRHVVAALLNSASSGVNYDLTTAQVIQLFNNLYPASGSEYNKLKDYFQKFNEQGCPLN